MKKKTKWQWQKQNRQKWSDARLGRGNPMFEKHHTEETKKKLSNSLSGYRWWTNGLTAIFASSCPEGFAAGRKLNQSLKEKSAEMSVEKPEVLQKKNTVVHPDNDIPEEEHKLSFDEYCNLFNACDDPATFYVPEDQLSEECKRRCLEAEAREHDSEDDLFIARYRKSFVDRRSMSAMKLHEERTRWCLEHGIDPNDKKTALSMRERDKQMVEVKTLT